MLKKAISLVLALMMATSVTDVLSAMAEMGETDIGYIRFDPVTGTITDCDERVTRVVIPEEIEGVAVTGIGEGAFSSCSLLESVSMPGVKSIAGNAFENCGRLVSVEMPNVERIEAGAFMFCGLLERVYLPKTAAEIVASSFLGCDALTEIEVDPENPNFKSEDGVLFDKSGTALIAYPMGKAQAEPSYKVPEGVLSIGENAFGNCPLKAVEMPSVTHIGEAAFWYCASLERVYLPQTVTEIVRNPFLGCDALTEIEVDAENPNFKSENGVLFDKSGTTLIAYPTGKAQAEPSYKVPEGVLSIGFMAFSYCSLRAVEMPSVTQIGAAAFLDSKALESVAMPNAEVIGESAFADCQQLKNAALPKASHIGGGAFYYCRSLLSAAAPNAVEIGDMAFDSCSWLERVYLSKKLTSIGKSAFNDCFLNDVYFEGTETDREKISVGEYNDALLNASWHYNYVFEKEEETGQSLGVSVNGSLIELDQAPIIENGRALVPMRAIFEALGAKVEWNAETMTATGEKDGTEISITVGSYKMWIDGEEKTLDCPAEIVNGRMLVPARAIAEAFGASVSWDNVTRRVVIEN